MRLHTYVCTYILKCTVFERGLLGHICICTLNLCLYLYVLVWSCILMMAMLHTYTKNVVFQFSSLSDEANSRI